MESEQPQPDINIDLHNLVGALKKYPLEFQQATQNLPELKKLMALAKFNISTVKAHLYNEIQATGRYDKVTPINAEVLVKAEYIEAQEYYLNAQKNYEHAYSVKVQLLQKENALRGLITLFESRYWSIDTNVDMATLQK